MSSKEVVIAAAEPEFYARVSFAALKVAAAVCGEKNGSRERVGYANRIMRGEDNAVLLAQHVAASSSAIAKALEKGDDVSDKDIETALKDIWDARSSAFAIHLPPPPAETTE